eukprot:94152_1
MSQKSSILYPLIDMNWLKNNKQQFYKKRKKIIEKRIEHKIHQYNGTIVPIDGDGNCMINAYLYHINQLSLDNATTQRQKLVQYMMKNSHEYKDIMPRNEILDFCENGKYLDEIHLKALHKMNKINILLFEYHIESDQLSQNYYYDPTFQECHTTLYLIYYRHSNHYNYCSMPNDFPTPMKAGFKYNKIGTKYTELHKLDLQLFNENNEIMNINQNLNDTSYPRAFDGCSKLLTSDSNILNENSNKINLMNVRIDRLMNTLKLYKQQINSNSDIQLDSAQMVNILDNFFSILKSNNIPYDAIYETVSNQLGECKPNECFSLNRNIRQRNVNDAKQRILDKIHCFYFHMYDTGYRLTQSEAQNLELTLNDEIKISQINELLKLKRNMISAMKCKRFQRRINLKYNQLEAVQDTYTAEEEIEMYHFGYDFKYGFKNESVGPDYITVLPKYASLKEEILSNPFYVLSAEQYIKEIDNTCLYFKTRYRKQTFDDMSFECLLSLLVYCNYFDFQYVCCKTYRVNNGMDHNNFYYIAKNLKISVHQFGTRTLESDTNVFYRGMLQYLVFPRYINGVILKCPTSTTTSFPVAVNFTNNNQGLVVEFSGSHSFNKYLSLSWCSDFANEDEHLFVQNIYPLDVTNIIEPMFGYEHRSILDALRILDRAVNRVVCNKQTDLWCSEHILLQAIISNQLSQFFTEYRQFKSLSEYGRHIISTYCNNQQKIELDSFDLPVIPSLFDLDAKWIKMKHLNSFFPNIQYITIHNAIVTNIIMNDILNHLQYFPTQIKCIQMIDIANESGLTVQDIERIYGHAFDALQFNISENKNSFLITRKHCIIDNQQIKSKHYFSWRSKPIYYDFYRNCISNKIISETIEALYTFMQVNPSNEMYEYDEKILTNTINCILDNNLDESYFQQNNKHHFVKLLSDKPRMEYIWNYLSKDSSGKKKSVPAFQTFGQRLISCSGDCGSKLAQLIDIIVYRKPNKEMTYWTKTIEGAFWCEEFPIRNKLIDLMKEEKLDENIFYTEIYKQLSDKNCFITGDKWTKKIITLFSDLAIDNYIHILEHTANLSCQSNYSTLYHEINAYYQRELHKLKSELKIITTMIQTSNYGNVKTALCEHKANIEHTISKTHLRSLDTKYYEERIREIKNSRKYHLLEQNNMALSNFEILSIVLYCDNEIFAHRLRETHRNNNLNSCHWNKLFGHLYSAVEKLFNTFHYKNDRFYRKYVNNKRKKQLFHGCRGVSLNSDYISELQLCTVSSFAESFGIANDFANNNGMVLAVNNAYEAVYKGELKAANVSWMSIWSEEEWIVLPTKLKSINKLSSHQNNHVFSFDEQCVEMYEANVNGSKTTNACNIKTCQKIRRIINTLYCHFSNVSKVFNSDSIVQCVSEKIAGYEGLLDDCWHCYFQHYKQEYDLDLSLIQKQYVPIAQNVDKCLKEFFNLSDIVYEDRKQRCFSLQFLPVHKEFAKEIAVVILNYTQRELLIGGYLRLFELVIPIEIELLIKKFYHATYTKCSDQSKKKLKIYSKKELLISGFLRTIESMIMISKDLCSLLMKYYSVEFYSKYFDDTRYILAKEYTNIGPVFEYGKNWPDHVTEKYANLKEEVLKNIYAKLTANQWNTVLRKCQTIKNGNPTRKITHPKGEGENTNIQHLKLEHIVALKLYTDFDLLQREFKKTFRTNEPERMREFYHWRNVLQDTFDTINNQMVSKPYQPNILFH